jgi:uncharacterized protein (TIGR02246 family)
MTRYITVIFIALTVCCAIALHAEQSKDEDDIRQVQVRQALAWNQHDAAAYGKLFTEDGEVINVVGWWWKGRHEIQNKLTAAFAFVF